MAKYLSHDSFDVASGFLIDNAFDLANLDNRAFFTPEAFIDAMFTEDEFEDTLHKMGADDDTLDEMLTMIEDALEQEPRRDEGSDVIEFSQQMLQVITQSLNHAQEAGRETTSVPLLIREIMHLEDSLAANLLHAVVGDREGDFIALLVEAYPEHDEDEDEDEEDYRYPGDDFLSQEELDELEELFGSKSGHNPKPQNKKPEWMELVTCINDHVDDHNPLIGREAELDRTIQVLCRKDKNNPLHLGEPGVGKTALIYGLAKRIQDGKVPDDLKGACIYEMDLGGMLAGTQYRGDFEKRLKQVLDGASQEENAIIYIDEIHTIVGAGRTNDSALDAGNMLKPYLESGRLRFIGATTYEEYNRNIARSKGLMRRFQTIDVPEPSIDEAIKIIKALKPSYEEFHHVTYDDDALEMAVKASAKHITERRLPDKAIDLVDEAGASLHVKKRGPRVVDRRLMAQTLARVAHVTALEEKDDDNDRLLSLRERIMARVFGQDTAVTDVVQAVQMAKAGLLDPNKPLSSLLFVGPTGVGKTEVARVLAQEMGVELVRFDMSEYMEKHSVAKLIGSPAGYVGYDDGGLLTDAVRRAPDCVLLLDEIEKAHEDVFNILLQVMDYGMLTDNKGRKTSFHNVVIIMTSNAGAQWAHNASVGFTPTTSVGGTMLKAVKKTFKPEFINRLSGIIVFNDMDRDMAGKVLDKKLDELRAMLKTRKVKLNLMAPAREALLQEGYSPQYGGREMDRVIHNRLKTLLVKEILFGSLKQGGTARVTLRQGQLVINPQSKK